MTSHVIRVSVSVREIDEYTGYHEETEISCDDFSFSYPEDYSAKEVLTSLGRLLRLVRSMNWSANK